MPEPERREASTMPSGHADEPAGPGPSPRRDFSVLRALIEAQTDPEYLEYLEAEWAEGTAEIQVENAKALGRVLDLAQVHAAALEKIAAGHPDGGSWNGGAEAIASRALSAPYGTGTDAAEGPTGVVRTVRFATDSDAEFVADDVLDQNANFGTEADEIIRRTARQIRGQG